MNESYVLTVLKPGLHMLIQRGGERSKWVKLPRCRMLLSQRQFHLCRGMIPLPSSICFLHLSDSAIRVEIQSWRLESLWLPPALLASVFVGILAWPQGVPDADGRA